MYTECPHCSAIFTLPVELTASKVRCGECGTIFNTQKKMADDAAASHADTVSIKAQTPEETPASPLIEPDPSAGEHRPKSQGANVFEDLTESHEGSLAEIDIATMSIEEIENIDNAVNQELDHELEKLAAYGDDKAAEDALLENDFLYESKAMRKLGDTIELPVLDDMDYNDHSDSMRRNDFADTLSGPTTDETEAMTDDFFEEFISNHELNTPESSITSKSSGESIQDRDDLLPDLDPDLNTPETLADLHRAQDKLSATADDLIVQQAPPNSVFSDADIQIDDTSEIALPDFDELSALQMDANQIVDEVRVAATNDDVIRDVPFEKDESHENFEAEQQSLELGQPEVTPYDELPGLSGRIDNNEALQESFLDAEDGLISLEQFDFDHSEGSPVSSKREFLYEHRKTIGVSALLALLCITLTAQYLRHNREQFKHYAYTRPLAEAVCAVSNCTVTPPRRPDMIQIMEHSIYPHKSIENALTVKAKVVNNANEAQPFPVLQVNFFNLSGDKIATRRFGPNEYLNKLPRRNGFMPNKEPVFFEFNVADPGRAGVSFDLLIR